jgi:hypothetical protein
LERGKLSILREGPEGPFYNHQFPQDGKYVTRYVPRDQVPAVQQAIDGYKEFDQLVERYVDEMVQKTRAEIAAGSKKNRAATPVNPGPKRRNPATHQPLCDRTTKGFDGAAVGDLDPHGRFQIGQ